MNFDEPLVLVIVLVPVIVEPWRWIIAPASVTGASQLLVPVTFFWPPESVVVPSVRSSSIGADDWVPNCPLRVRLPVPVFTTR